MVYYKNELDAIKNMNRFELIQLRDYYKALLNKEYNEYIDEMIQTINSELKQDELMEVV